MRYLTSLALKILNSSLKSEFIRTAWWERMCINGHLPGSLEYCRGTAALPISYVKRAVHVSQPAITLHRECRRLVHINYFSAMDLTAGGAWRCPTTCGPGRRAS